MEFLQKYALYIVLAFNLLLGWASWSMSRAFATKAELAATQKEVTTQAARIDTLETLLKQLPNKDDLHALQLQLVETMGELKSITNLVKVERANLGEQYRRHEAILSRHEEIFSSTARKQS